MGRIKGHKEERLRTEVYAATKYMLQRKMCGNPKRRMRPRCYLIKDDLQGTQTQIALSSTEFWTLWESTRPLSQLFHYWQNYKSHVYEYHYKTEKARTKGVPGMEGRSLIVG